MCVCVLQCVRLSGTGIRMEDDVIVTAGAAEVLNTDCPETVQELEKLIGSSCDRS